MAVDGLLSSYGLTGGHVVTIDPIIKQLDPDDLPFQNGSTLGGFPALPSTPVMNKKIEWQSDTRLLPLGSLNEGATVTTSDTTLTVVTGERFQAGDMVRIDDEVVYVSSRSGNDLTVVRGFAGTTAATHAATADVMGVGQVLAEGSDAVDASHVDRSRHYNYTQIFGPRKVKATGTEQVIPKYGLPDGGEFAYQLVKESAELAVHLDMALGFGERWDDGVDQRSMGGLNFFITTNTDASSTALTLASVEAQLQKMFDAGGKASGVWELWCSVANKLAVDKIDTSSIRLVREDNGRGQMVDYFDTSLGRVMLGVNRYYPDSTAHLITREDVGWGFLRPWQITPLAKTGDSDSVMLVAEASMKVEADRHHAKWTALAP